MTNKILSTLLSFILLTGAVVSAYGQNADTVAIKVRQPVRSDRYSVSLFAVYGWNTTWQNHGGFDITSHIPINRHFELDAAFEYHNPSVCAVSAYAKPKFPLPTGEIFLNGAVLSRFFSKYRMTELTMAALVGYRMDYVSAEIGIASHTLFDMAKPAGSESENVTEPFMISYRVAFNVRPATSCWNISLGAGNFNEFGFDRPYYPIFFLGGHYDIDNNLTVLLRAELHPSGIFNQTTHFWGAYIRAGVSYVF